MNAINLEKILKRTTVSEEEILQLLFPNATHKKAALKRIVTGKGLLDEMQIQRLASRLGCDETALFNNSCDWVRKDCEELGVLTLEKQGHTVLVNTLRGTADIYYSDNVGHETILFVDAITLTKLTNKLTKTINSYERTRN